MEFEIYFDNLNLATQAELLKAYNIKNPEEMNWDVVPIAII